MPSMDGVLKKLVDALLRLNIPKVHEVLSGLLAGENAWSSIESVVVPALEYIGRSWEEGRVSLSQVYMAGRICEKAVGELLPSSPAAYSGSMKLAIGVIEDHHALGKRMVKSALYSSGYQPLDYGHGLKASELVAKALDDRIDILLVSCLMLASAVRVEALVAGLHQAGSPTLVVVGGAPFRLDPGLWREVGAQAMGSNSAEAVQIIQKIAEDRSWA